MDADSRKKPRDRCISQRREERWSMDTQRFEVILTEIRNAYNNIRRNFNQVDLPEILETLVTEYALRAMREGGAGVGAGAEPGTEPGAEPGTEPGAEPGAEPPRFTELAVLLQHCSELYGKKVDYLYQNVLDLRDSFSEAYRRSTEERGEGDPGGGEAGAAGRRRRARSGAGAGAGAGAAQFAAVELARCAGARRSQGALRPPPTLPRMYVELEPRVLLAHDAPLRDYDGEDVGLPGDFYLCDRLHNGALVEELSHSEPTRRSPLRPICLLRLQEALEACAPARPSTPPPPRTPPPAEGPLAASTPPPAEGPLAASTPLQTAADAGATPEEDSGIVADAGDHSDRPEAEDAAAPDLSLATRKRKRKLDAPAEPLRLFVTEELRSYLATPREFSLPERWISRVVALRVGAILDRRRQLAELAEPSDRVGFPGWGAAEAAEAAAAARALADAATVVHADSDDDGFYDRSSFSSLESSRRAEEAAAEREPDGAAAAAADAQAEAEARAGAERAAWSAAVVARALREQARAADAQRLVARVRERLRQARELTFAELVRAEGAGRRDVSWLLLAALLLASSGEIEIIQCEEQLCTSFVMRPTATFGVGVSSDESHDVPPDRTRDLPPDRTCDLPPDRTRDLPPDPPPDRSPDPPRPHRPLTAHEDGVQSRRTPDVKRRVR